MSSSTTSSSAIHFRIRRMKIDDIPQVLDIWAENNLHEGTQTIQSFMIQDPDGFYVAVEIENDFDNDNNDNNDNNNDNNNGDGQQQLDGKNNPKYHYYYESSTESNDDLEQQLKFQNLDVVQVLVHGDDDHNDDDNDNDANISGKKQTSKQCRFKKQPIEKRIIGMCAGVFVHPTIAFIGLYGVKPELQGRGIGIKIWNRMMKHIGSLNGGLYALPEHLTMYRDRAGFRYPDERFLLIYESNFDDHLNLDILVPSIRETKITKITAEWYKKCIEYDSKVHGYVRAKLLPHVFTEEGTASFLACDLNGQEIFGYGCIRTNNIGKAMLGPLYANNDAIAELLMRYLFTALSGPFHNGLLYMTLDSNPGGERIAEKIGLKKHEEIGRFFLHEPYINANWDQVYCIHSPNFSLL